MKSDKELYKLFSSCPELLFNAANSKPCDTYKMVSITLKEFERRSDGFYSQHQKIVRFILWSFKQDGIILSIIINHLK